VAAVEASMAAVRGARKTSIEAYPYAFTAELEELEIGGTMRYWVVFLPAKLQKKAPFAAKKKLRMRGVVGGPGGKPVSMAWQVSRGRHYVMFGRALARSLGLALGHSVDIAFDVVDPDDVDVPEELREALYQEPDWEKLWSALTPGKQRGLAHMVRSVKSPELRAQRAVDVMRAVEAGNVPGPPRRRRE
jgi:hypothetical protein